jgi:site-specific recombinase XerD
VTEQLSHTAFRNIVETCRAPATRNAYTKSLRLFLKYLRLEETDYDKLIEKDPKIIQQDICDYILYMRKRGLSSASVSTYLSGLVKFYSMNDITLNWLKIHSFEGEQEKQREDRPYTHSEIKLLIEHAGPRNRAIILLLCSSGARVGAIPIMRIKDLEPVDSHKIYKITYYPKSKRFRYFSFCTPEGTP